MIIFQAFVNIDLVVVCRDIKWGRGLRGGWGPHTSGTVPSCPPLSFMKYGRLTISNFPCFFSPLPVLVPSSLVPHFPYAVQTPLPYFFTYKLSDFSVFDTKVWNFFHKKRDSAYSWRFGIQNNYKFNVNAKWP